MKPDFIQIYNANYPIRIGNKVLPDLNAYFEQHYGNVRKFILVDENTRKYCFPKLAKHGVTALEDATVIEIPSGEEHKKLKTCHLVWQALLDGGADRNSVLINLGGGVICDLGGFVAATFKRGIDFVHVPTTLLSQVDASVGGKVGVDLGSLKNQVGVFANPAAVFIYPRFLKTLYQRNRLSGFAEGVKHAMIWDPFYWEVIEEMDFSDAAGDGWEKIIALSVKIKNEVVLKDPLERGSRRVLNFGHTIGHALESYRLEIGEPMLHGEAVAVGMICETFLSERQLGFSAEGLDKFVHFMFRYFPPFEIPESADDRLLELMLTDKKNQNGEIRFTLLKSIGTAKIDETCTPELIREALNYYRSVCAKAISLS